MRHWVSKCLIMHGVGIIAVYSHMDRPAVVKVTQWWATAKTKESYQWLVMKSLEGYPTTTIQNLSNKFNSVCWRSTMKKYKTY